MGTLACCVDCTKFDPTHSFWHTLGIWNQCKFSSRLYLLQFHRHLVYLLYRQSEKVSRFLRCRVTFGTKVKITSIVSCWNCYSSVWFAVENSWYYIHGTWLVLLWSYWLKIFKHMAYDANQLDHNGTVFILHIEQSKINPVNSCCTTSTTFWYPGFFQYIVQAIHIHGSSFSNE